MRVTPRAGGVQDPHVHRGSEIAEPFDVHGVVAPVAAEDDVDDLPAGVIGGHAVDPAVRHRLHDVPGHRPVPPVEPVRGGRLVVQGEQTVEGARLEPVRAVRLAGAVALEHAHPVQGHARDVHLVVAVVLVDGDGARRDPQLGLDGAVVGDVVVEGVPVHVVQLVPHDHVRERAGVPGVGHERQHPVVVVLGVARADDRRDRVQGPHQLVGARPAVVEGTGGVVPGPVGLVPQLPAVDVGRAGRLQAVVHHGGDLLLPVVPTLPPVGEGRVDVRHADELLGAGPRDVVPHFERVAARLGGAVAEVRGAGRRLREAGRVQRQQHVGARLGVGADAVQPAGGDLRRGADDLTDVDVEGQAFGAGGGGGPRHDGAEGEGEDAESRQRSFHSAVHEMAPR